MAMLKVFLFFCNKTINNRFIDPILPPVPKQYKKQVERLLCSDVLTFFFALLSISFQLIAGKTISMPNSMLFVVNLLSVSLFLKGNCFFFFLLNNV
jgi:hypothetical protein